MGGLGPSADARRFQPLPPAELLAYVRGMSQADLARRTGIAKATVSDLVDGKGSFFEKLKAAKHPLVIVGMGALARPDGAAVVAMARELVENLGAVREDWNGFAVLHTAAAA